MEGDGEGELHPRQDQGVKFHGVVSPDQAERAGAAVKHIEGDDEDQPGEHCVQ